MKTIVERNLKHLNIDEKQKHLDNWSNFRNVSINQKFLFLKKILILVFQEISEKTNLLLYLKLLL